MTAWEKNYFCTVEMKSKLQQPGKFRPPFQGHIRGKEADVFLQMLQLHKACQQMLYSEPIIPPSYIIITKGITN